MLPVWRARRGMGLDKVTPARLRVNRYQLGGRESQLGLLIQHRLESQLGGIVGHDCLYNSQ